VLIVKNSASLKKFFWTCSLLLVATCCRADQTPIELTISLFIPKPHVQYHAVIAPWAREIETLSHHRVHFTLYPRSVLAPAEAQYGLAESGKVDFAFSLPAYTPGRFPLVDGIMLPFMVRRAESASIVLWNAYRKFFPDEFDKVKVLWITCHGPGQLMTREKPVRCLGDLAGLRIRTPDPLVAKVVERLGGIAVSMPITQAFAALKSGEVDGVVAPFEAVIPFRFHEVCRYYTTVNLYTMPFFFVMNPNAYAALPGDIQQIIDAHSGEALCAHAGQAFDVADAEGIDMVKRHNGEIIHLSAAELEPWRRAAMPVGDEWVQEMARRELPGVNVLNYLVRMLMAVDR
jgi:TRAP-type C4-dicarboxylate transport system substrate-binding protein